MFNKRTSIQSLLTKVPVNQEVTIMGWVRNFRNNQFLNINDGSCPVNFQVVLPLNTFPDDLIKRLSTNASVSVTGNYVESVGKGQAVEIIATSIIILGDADATQYPLQPKKHSLEFLREHAHLRMRTNTMASVFRVRHHLAFSVHKFFHERNFFYINTPIITASDAEGAGEMFQVTTLPINNAPTNEDGTISYENDFFGKKTHLTVSGQLEGELAATALSNIYTFGPTFRAENSNTTRHLAEFWMIEPEMAFYDLEDNMNLAESFIKQIIADVLSHCSSDLSLLESRLTEEESKLSKDQRSSQTLMEKLTSVRDTPFERITYSEAIIILQNSSHYKKKKFKYDVQWGCDLQSEHERYLVEKHFNKPVIVYNYPKDIKAFYMRQNDDTKTVAAMDILAPGIGEIVGGSQREERLETLLLRMNDMNISTEELSWYLDTRRFGTVPHAGFGLGFERLVQFVTGMGNIRDVIPFPRSPKNADY
jgi:asparaginyl-tRNA synthetase